MLDFPGFCYLDVQKTGSTFVSEFLLRHSKDPPVAWVEHARAKPRKGVFYFTTCRAPLSLYRSLYAFGCEGRGAFHRFQIDHDTPLASTYTGTAAGFRSWLDLVLSDDRAAYSAQGVAGYHNAQLGMMTLRFLRLNLRNPMTLVPLARGRSAIDGLWALRRLPDVVLRQETLNEDLAALVGGQLAPFLKDPQAALDELARPNPVNVSGGNSDALLSELPNATLERLRRLESFFHRQLGYD